MIYLFGEVNEKMSSDLARRLDKKPGRVNILLCSEGGNISDGLAIYDRIKTVPDSTITATGICWSAAAFILQAAKVRRATPNTQFLMHLTEIENPDDKEARKIKVHLDVTFGKIFAAKIGYRNYSNALDKTVFGIEEALKYGLIDSVYTGEKNDGTKLFERPSRALELARRESEWGERYVRSAVPHS